MKVATQTAPETYDISDGGTMRREDGKTPNGNELNNRWVLRDGEGRPVDFDKYRNDLADRNDIEIVAT